MVTIFDGALAPEILLGILFLAVLPSTVQSSIAFTSIAGGNVPAAICAASVSNIIGVALTPGLVALLLHTGDGGVRFDAVAKIGTQILLPFIVDRGSILLIVYSAFSAGTVSGLWRAIPVSSLITLYVVILVFLAITMFMMVGMGRVTKLPKPDRSVLFYCGSTKSLASGLPIATALFAPETVGAIVLPVMMYHMSQLLVCAFISQKEARSADA
jgi:sodium/bile acid cotransporter 7